MTLNEVQEWYSHNYKYFNQQGYILALHGSMVKYGSGDDIDLIAIPYVENPTNINVVVRTVFPTAKQHCSDSGLLFVILEENTKIDILFPRAFES